MNSFELLSKKVEDGSVDLLNIIATPRSISTALGRAMNETGLDSIFVNEPFNRNNRNLDVASQWILDQADNAIRHTDGPLTVVTKNMATYIGEKDFSDLEGISACTIWSVRDPRIQIGSLVTRMANDIAIENGADGIHQEDVAPYIEEVSKVLANSDISVNFSRTGWQSIGEHFSRKSKELKYVVIDGEELVADPTQILKGACKRLNLPYRSSMVTGWRSRYVNINTGTSRFVTEDNAWTNHAAISEGLVKTMRQPLDFSTLPQELLDHINAVAIPTYLSMKSDVGSSPKP